MQKKRFVMDAHMGSGKTKQMVTLVNATAEIYMTVCVILFHRYLVLQQARRLRTCDYQTVDYDAMLRCPVFLTILPTEIGP